MVLEGRVQGKGDRMEQSGYAARSHNELPVCTSQSEKLSRGECLPSRFAFKASASLCGTCLVLIMKLGKVPHLSFSHLVLFKMLSKYKTLN